MPVVYSRAGVFLLLLFSLVDPLKFGYACEMSPLTTAGLLIKSRDPYIGSRIFGGAQVIGGTFYGTIVGALAVRTDVPVSGCATSLLCWPECHILVKNGAYLEVKKAVVLDQMIQL